MSKIKLRRTGVLTYTIVSGPVAGTRIERTLFRTAPNDARWAVLVGPFDRRGRCGPTLRRLVQAVSRDAEGGTP